MSTHKIAINIFAAALVLGSCSLAAQEQSPAALRQQIEQVLRQYILDHPEVVLESLKTYQQREQVAQRDRAKGLIVAREAELLHDASSPAAGKAGADIAVVEFFDYRCGFCKKIQPTLVKLLADNPRLRVVFKEFPILGPESMIAAKASLAAQRQGSYLRFQEELMTTTEPLNLENIEKIAVKLGLDAAKLSGDMEAPEILRALSQSQELGAAIGVNATPSFVIGSELVSGVVDAAQFQALINKAIAAADAKTTRPAGL